CRILEVTPEGELRVLAGGDGCGLDADGPAQGARISVGTMALDAAGLLYFTDPPSHPVPVLEPASGMLRTVLGGIADPVDAFALAVGPGLLAFTDGAGQLQLLNLATSEPTVVARAVPDSSGCDVPLALQACDPASCRPSVDPAGAVFLAGT